jgi:hypothetical protein
LAASSEAMSQIEIHGAVWGKTGDSPATSDTRVVLPLGAIPLLLDKIMEITLADFLESALPDTDAVWHGARPGTQCQDIAHCAQLCIEKCMDSKSQGGILQADVRRYYDSICLFRVGSWLTTKGYPKADVAVLLRLHWLCPIRLSVCSTSFLLGPRTLGTLTGARSSVVVGRIPVADTAAACREVLCRAAFATPLGKICLATWVDNLFFFGPRVAELRLAVEAFEAQLRSRWRLQLKPSSLQALLPRGSSETAELDARWDIMETMRVLGHWIDDDAGIRGCWAQTRTAMWRSFYRNSGSRKAKLLTADRRAVLLSRATLPVATFRFSRWPPQKQVALELDALQMKFFGIAAGYRMHPSETPVAFVRRRQRTIKQVLHRRGWWSQLWFKRSRAWDAHLDRHPDSPAAKMRSWQGESWLESARAVWANIRTSRARPWTMTAGRTDTRVAPGRPQTRWHEGLRFAEQVCSRPFEWPLRRHR